ncbi:MAG: hypothetical protein R3C44_20110 [Chloroflexota bacterium]
MKTVRIVTIQDGDSAYALSVNRSVPLEAIIQVNRQTADSIQLLNPVIRFVSPDYLCRYITAYTRPFADAVAHIIARWPQSFVSG